MYLLDPYNKPKFIKFSACIKLNPHPNQKEQKIKLIKNEQTDRKLNRARTSPEKHSRTAK